MEQILLKRKQECVAISDGRKCIAVHFAHALNMDNFEEKKTNKNYVVLRCILDIRKIEHIFQVGAAVLNVTFNLA